VRALPAWCTPTKTIVSLNGQGPRSGFALAGDDAQAFCDAVETALGRRVIGFFSQVHVNPDLSIETFILESDSANEAGAEG
jgi:hypothetical protein